PTGPLQRAHLRLLVVIDGAKALAAAVRDVFGEKALVQRCTLHKRRNVADHLPDKDKDWVDAKLVSDKHHEKCPRD
ncbi:transposase, partial [Mycobacterium marinum]|uniref:transposase n=1 Tax=Mycobacterium marinum TaxID=1781 RepID=UPI00356A536F